MTVDYDKPVLVTGASGFVGNNLVRYLLQRGRKVRTFVRDPDNISLGGLNVESCLGDVLHPASLLAAMADVSTVFHLAGAISIDGQQHSRMRQVNAKGTANVVDSCLESGVGRLVHFSSIHALSYLPKDQPIDECRELALDPDKHLAYDQSKAAAEQQVLTGITRGLNAILLNPVGIFGPHDFDPSPGGEFLQQLIHRKLPGLVQGGYYWVDVRDVVRAAVLAEEKGRSGEKYILAGDYATFKSISSWVQEACGSRPPFLNIPISFAKIVAPLIVWYSRWLGIRPLVTPEAIQIIGCHQNISTDKAAVELGFQTRPIKETLIDTVNWMQDNERSNRIVN